MCDVVRAAERRHVGCHVDVDPASRARRRKEQTKLKEDSESEEEDLDGSTSESATTNQINYLGHGDCLAYGCWRGGGLLVS